MKAVRFEFVEKKPMPAPVWLCVAAIGFLIAIFNVWLIWSTYREMHLAEINLVNAVKEAAQQQELKRLISDRQNSPKPYALDAVKTSKISSMPVNGILASVENVRVQGIQISSIDVSSIDGVVRVELLFTDHATLLKYLAELNIGEDPQKWSLVDAHRNGAGIPQSNSAIITSVWINF